MIFNETLKITAADWAREGRKVVKKKERKKDGKERGRKNKWKKGRKEEKEI